MLTIDHTQFQKLMLPMPQEYTAREFIRALEVKYGIKDMIALEPNIRTSWNVYFVSPYAETFFRITYAEML